MPGGVGRIHFINEDDKAPKFSKQTFYRILSYFKPYGFQLTVTVIAILIMSILNLVPSLLLKNIIDTALPQKNISLLALLVIISILTTIIINLIQVGQSYLNTWISKRISYNIKNEMYHHLQGMSLSFFTLAKPGEITTRLSSDIDGIQDIYNSTVVNALSSGFTLITTAIVLFGMNWQLAILSMIVLPLFIFPTRTVGKLRWKIAIKTQEKSSELTSIIQETLGISGLILMKIFTKEKNELVHFEKTNADLIKLQLHESLVGRWFFMTIQSFMAIGPMLVYFCGGYLMIKGQMSVGEIIAFVALLSRLYAPVTQLSNIHIDVTRSFALFGRIFEYLDQDQMVKDKDEAKAIQMPSGQIDFNAVHFAYQPTNEILHGITFCALPSTITALVGPSGAGKTTITNLIPRLYDVLSGSVTIDGTDVRDVTMTSLRSHIGIVMQEPYLFNSSIKDNLLYAKFDATQDEIEASCKAAYIHDFILTLPQGYGTIVGNRGIKLSGGEKQRLSIARVILKDPKIIILDEATSSLDSVSEEYIQKAMGPLLIGRTSIVIAHRLSTILMADKILVIQAGELIEQGKHEELLALKGLYAHLYETQFKAQLSSKNTEPDPKSA